MTADRFYREAEYIGDLLSRHGQDQARLRAGNAVAQPVGHFDQEAGDLLFGIHAAKQQHPAPGPVEFAERAFEQFVFKPRMFARKTVEVRAFEHADLRLGQRFDAIR